MSQLIAKLLDGSDEVDVDCFHCRWHEYNIYNNGICRKNPPTFVHGRGTFWPVVSDEDYCESFELDTKHPYEILPHEDYEVFPSGDK